MRILPRGNWLDESGRGRRARPCPHFLPQIETGRPARHAARPRALADLARQPAHRPRLRQPAVEAVLRPGPRRARSTTSARRASGRRTRSCSTGWPSSSWTSGWDVKHLVRMLVTSATYRQSSRADARSSSSAIPTTGSRAAGALPARRRDGPRQRAGRQRPAVDRGSAARASSRTSRAGYWALPELPAARVGRLDTGEDLYRRGLYTYWQRTFLQPEPARLRRAEPRGMHGRAAALEHAAAGAGAAQRPDLRRGRPRLRRADPARGRARRVEDRLRWAFARALGRAPRADEERDPRRAPARSTGRSTAPTRRGRGAARRAPGQAPVADGPRRRRSWRPGRRWRGRS